MKTIQQITFFRIIIKIIIFFNDCYKEREIKRGWN